MLHNLQKINMKIKFKLRGVVREIRYDKYSFMASNPAGKTAKPLGHYTTIGGAINKHLTDAMIPHESEEEEVLSLREFVDRYESLKLEVLGATIEELRRSPAFCSEEATERKIGANIKRQAKPEVEDTPFDEL